MQEFLKKIGLSEKEVSIYIYLLKKDSDTIAQIAKNTQINRTTVYPVVEQLIEKGFVIEEQKNSKPIYKANTPDRIESYLKEQKTQIEEQMNQAKDIIPQIKGVMFQDGDLPIIEYYEGREAILQSSKIYFPTKEDKEIFFIYPRDTLRELFSEKERTIARSLRIDNHVPARSLYTSSEDYIPETNTDDDQRIRIDGEQFPISADIAVFGDKVRIHMLKNKLGTLFIRNKDVAETLKTLFRLAFHNKK